MKKVGDPCPYCKVPLSAETMEKKKQARIANALASVEKMKANGTYRGGPPRSRDDELIKELYAERVLSIRQIATLIGCSSSTVWKSLREQKTPDTGRKGD